MSSISSLNSSASLMYQLLQAASTKQAQKTTAPTPGQQVQAASSDHDHDGDTDGASSIDLKA